MRDRPSGLGAGPTASSRPSWRERVGAWARTHPGMVVALLVPVAVFGIAELFGGAFLTGDNLIQNLPMRHLVGWDLDHGIWPLWNPYTFSGTPLLGGFNAGAAYPATWLTAVLPLFTAWTITLVVAYDLALVGMYLFLRRQPMGTTAATLGAVTFAFAGYMTGQMVHIDLIEGASWLPWMLLAVHALTRDRGAAPASAANRSARERRRRWWAVLLAVSFGLSVLSGNAEAVIDSAVLAVIYLVGRLVTTGLLRGDRRRALASSLAAVVGGVAGGVALSAAQWLPGLQFLAQSQRSSTTYAYFASGALDNRLVSLVFSPFLLGTNQFVPGMYAGSYNFPEVTSYAGILALIAACSLLLRRWRTRPEARQWWVWYVILVVGLLSALGGDTPFGRVLYAIPGISSERLTNRNILLVDVALAVLLAWWAHVLISDRSDGARSDGARSDGARSDGARPDPAAPDRPGLAAATTLRARWREGPRSELVVPALPLAVMVVACILLWADGAQLQRWLDIANPMSTSTRRGVAVVVTGQVAVAAWATWVVLVERRFSASRLARLLSAALALDLVLFNCFVIQPPIGHAQAQAQGATSTTFASLVGDGRFIIYNPNQFDVAQAQQLGETDLNIYDQLPSAQGYTALTDGNYYRATGSHYQEDLNPRSLAGTVWDGLNVTTLLSMPGYFLSPVASGSDRSGPGPSIQFDQRKRLYRGGSRSALDAFHVTPGTPRRWYFGAVLTLSSWDVPVPAGSTVAGSTSAGSTSAGSTSAGSRREAVRFRAGLVTPTGGLQWLPADETAVVGADASRTLRVTLPHPVRSGGIVLGIAGTVPSAPANSRANAKPKANAKAKAKAKAKARATVGVGVGVPKASTLEGGDVALDGVMQYGATSPHWRFTGTFGPFGVFRNSSPQGWAQLRAPGGGTAPAGSSVHASAPAEGGGSTIAVHATSALDLIRSAAWSQGWHATVRSVRHVDGRVILGPGTRAAVTRDGVLQEVALPAAGDYRVTFYYGPSTAKLGILVTGVTIAALVLFGLAELVDVKRRRRGHA